MFEIFEPNINTAYLGYSTSAYCTIGLIHISKQFLLMLAINISLNICMTMNLCFLYSQGQAEEASYDRYVGLLSEWSDKA